MQSTLVKKYFPPWPSCQDIPRLHMLDIQVLNTVTPGNTRCHRQLLIWAILSDQLSKSFIGILIGFFVLDWAYEHFRIEDSLMIDFLEGNPDHTKGRMFVCWHADEDCDVLKGTLDEAFGAVDRVDPKTTLGYVFAWFYLYRTV